MRSIPAAAVLPFRELIRERGVLEINGGIEFVEIGALRSLDLTVQMRGSQFDRPKFDPPFQKSFLKFDGKELAATIGLNPLKCKRHFVHHQVEELQCIGSYSA